MAAESSPAGPAGPAAPVTAPAGPNPAVRDILRSGGGPAATPVRPITSAPSMTGDRPLSENPEAVRARNRRAAARARSSGTGPGQGQPAGRASFVRPRAGGGPQYTPDQLRAGIAALPPAPSSPPSPEQIDKATKNIAMIIRGAGWLAATIFKREYMRVPDADARETAGAILEGYPELANESDADYRKIMAWAAVGGLTLERYSRYQRERANPAAVLPRAATSSGTGEGGAAGRVNGAPPDDLPPTVAMMPVNM